MKTEVRIRNILETRERERSQLEERLACARLVHSFWVDWDDKVAMQCCEIIEKAILARGDA